MNTSVKHRFDYHGLKLAVSWILTVMLMFVETGILASDNVPKPDAFDLVKARVLERKVPAVITAAAAKLGNSPTESERAFAWAEFDGIQIAYLPSDEIEIVRKLAQDNESVLRTRIGPGMRESYRNDVNTSNALASGVIRMFVFTCDVQIDWRVTEEVRITMSSGSPIPNFEACRLFAWAFAANGVRFVPGRGSANTLILKNVNDPGQK